MTRRHGIHSRDGRKPVTHTAWIRGFFHFLHFVTFDARTDALGHLRSRVTKAAASRVTGRVTAQGVEA
jgi:hypothetical protein